jgi:hypothetical protein
MSHLPSRACMTCPDPAQASSPCSESRAWPRLQEQRDAAGCLGRRHGRAAFDVIRPQGHRIRAHLPSREAFSPIVDMSRNTDLTMIQASICTALLRKRAGYQITH